MSVSVYFCTTVDLMGVVEFLPGALEYAAGGLGMICLF